MNFAAAFRPLTKDDIADVLGVSGATNLPLTAPRNDKAPGAGTSRPLIYKLNSGRGERIRTSGLYVPNVALYQAKLHPESCVAPGDPGNTEDGFDLRGTGPASGNARIPCAT